MTGLLQYYVSLMYELRRAAHGTELAQAQMDTLRFGSSVSACRWQAPRVGSGFT
jgi:hypothetical protein